MTSFWMLLWNLDFMLSTLRSVMSSCCNLASALYRVTKVRPRNLGLSGRFRELDPMRRAHILCTRISLLLLLSFNPFPFSFLGCFYLSMLIFLHNGRRQGWGRRCIGPLSFNDSPSNGSRILSCFMCLGNKQGGKQPSNILSVGKEHPWPQQLTAFLSGNLVVFHFVGIDFGRPLGKGSFCTQAHCLQHKHSGD